MFAVIPRSQNSHCWAITPIDLEIPGYNIGWWLKKRHLIFFTVLNIAAGLLNQEKRGWMPREQMLSTHWKAMLISSEHMIMERRMVLSKPSIQDNSVDHEKVLHTHNRWEVSSSSSESFFFLFQKLCYFLKDLRIRLLSEFFALCEKETLVSEFGYSCLFVYWGKGMTRRDH